MNTLNDAQGTDAGLRAKARLYRINKRRFADELVLNGRRKRAWVRLGLACKLTFLTLALVFE